MEPAEKINGVVYYAETSWPSQYNYDWDGPISINHVEIEIGEYNKILPFTICLYVVSGKIEIDNKIYTTNELVDYTKYSNINSNIIIKEKTELFIFSSTSEMNDTTGEIKSNPENDTNIKYIGEIFSVDNKIIRESETALVIFCAKGEITVNGILFKKYQFAFDKGQKDINIKVSPETTYIILTRIS